MITENRLTDIEKQVIGLEKDTVSAQKLNSKFDQALDKLTEITLSIKEMLMVHDGQLKRHDNELNEIYKILENTKRETHLQHRDMMAEIIRSNDSISNKIGKLETDINESIKQKLKKVEDDTEKSLQRTSDLAPYHDKRIRWLERLMFIGLGVVTLVAIIIDKIPIETFL
jgi:hypothetical protein